MKKFILSLLFAIGFLCGNAQFQTKKAGKGLNFLGQDSTYHLKMAFRFQNLHVGDWKLADEVQGFESAYNSSFLVRRSRLKFDGWAYTPKLKFKLELGISNRDNSGGSSSEFNTAANIILDAHLTWNFYENFSLQFGQGKLPGNRERVISSGNLQFVDRSRLNSRYTLDRDMGLQLKHHFTIGDNFVVREVIAFTQGDGRNVTKGYFGGFGYTFRGEILPFGNFKSKGDYVGCAVKKESKPKFSLGVTYDINDNAVRERGQKGSFIDQTFAKNLNSLFVDFMFKYQNLSLMGEYAHRQTDDDNPIIINDMMQEIGTYYTGTGLNLQGGYMLGNNWELVLRYTTINPDADVANDENQYTFGISKFILGHKIKIQNDFTYREVDMSQNQFIWRTQVDFHF